MVKVVLCGLGAKEKNKPHWANNSSSKIHILSPHPVSHSASPLSSLINVFKLACRLMCVVVTFHVPCHILLWFTLLPFPSVSLVYFPSPLSGSFLHFCFHSRYIAHRLIFPLPLGHFFLSRDPFSNFMTYAHIKTHTLRHAHTLLMSRPVYQWRMLSAKKMDLNPSDSLQG